MNPQARSASTPWRSRALWVLKLGFTLFLLFLAFRKVPLRQLAAAWSRIQVGWSLLAVLGYLPLCAAAETARLWAAGRRVDAPPLRLREWGSAYLESRPWFYLLPAATGADAVVWFHLRRRGWTHGGCGFTLLSVRLWGLALWALVAGLTLVVVPSTKYILAGIPTWMSAWPLWIGGGCATVVICAIAPHWLARKERIDLKPIGWADPLLHLVLALLSALVNGGSIWIAAKATGVPFSLAACMGLLAWFNFAMALPVSLGGLGLQEALVLRLGMPMGIPASTLLAFSGIVHLTRVVLALSGGLLSILRSSSDRQVFPPVDANEGLP